MKRGKTTPLSRHSRAYTDRFKQNRDWYDAVSSLLEWRTLNDTFDGGKGQQRLERIVNGNSQQMRRSALQQIHGSVAVTAEGCDLGR
jgi:hypothetical protein